MGGVVADDVIGAGGLIHCHAMFRDTLAVRPSTTRFAAPPHVLAHSLFCNFISSQAASLYDVFCHYVMLHETDTQAREKMERNEDDL
jgi:hypothetical protein